jgi:class 3 adenylate cyclase
MAVCGTCGTEPLEHARFCHGCGSSVAERAAHAEYKQVTVLFADVVHSMDLAAAVGAERLREIMAELLERSTAVVQRFGGTVNQFTGDGIMAVFGAPLALEDHAIRACLAASGIQQEAKRLAVDVRHRDRVELQLRVGLNSGEVIVGEIGSGSFGYTAIGEQVGMAQRMESVAPPGGVMLSASTARLVEGSAVLGEPEMVHIKHVEEPLAAYRLFGVGDSERATERVESTLVGRRWELSAVEGLLDRAIDGHGGVVGIVGAPGIGKSRLVREVVGIAHRRGVDVFTSVCESHTSDIPFRVVARLLRAATSVRGLDERVARERVRAQAFGADPEDVQLFEDLLGIGDPNVALPKIDPDARRRRLTALVKSASSARTAPAVYVIEDTHWIDEVSESMLADFLMVIPQTPSLVLITYRPEYSGLLSTVSGAQSIALAPLSSSETTALVTDLIGGHPSTTQIAGLVADRAAGNPFFVEEIVRDLVERGLLQRAGSSYVATADLAEVSMPATVQATIAARIDRLNIGAKRTLSAAAVIGSRFSPGLLEALDIDPVVEDLVSGEFIDQITFGPQPEYLFHHPLIRTVAYESQLKTDRAELHRRVAAAIQSRDPAAAEENAALVAEHLEAAGDLIGAYGWHMRAATWATSRDIAAARRSWERAKTIADALPTETAQRAALRIAPRTMLCGTDYRVHANGVAPNHFDELRQLCVAADDKASLAIGLAGLVMDHAYQGRILEASRLASEAMALIESVGDPTLTVGLSYPAIYAKFESGQWPDVLRWSHRAIDLADGDPFKGNFIFGSPAALALTSRAMARYWLGRPGWCEDLRHGLDMARSADPLTFAAVVALSYCSAIPNGAVVPDDRVVREIEDALGIAEKAGNNTALAFARMALGLALVHRDTTDERDRGRTLLADISDVLARHAHNLGDRPLVDVYAAWGKTRRRDRDEAIRLIRASTDHLVREGQLLAWGTPATGVLVETLLDRGTESDVLEAEAAVELLAGAPAEEALALRDVWLLRLRALLARIRGDDTGYRDYRDRYRAMATEFGYEGHMRWAEAMP